MRFHTLMYEAAIVILHRVKRWLPLKDWAEAIERRSGSGKARVALARKLSVILHSIWRSGEPFREFLEAEGYGYAIRLPTNSVLQGKIGHLLKRPVGRPPQEVRRFFASFSYRAQSWNKARHVVAKVEWHPGELYPRVGFIVINLPPSAEGVVAFYNNRGTCEQYIKEGENPIKWTRLSCRTFAANAVRLQLHALAYNLGNFMRTLVPMTAEPIELQNALQVSKQHLDLFALAAGRLVALSLGDIACHVASPLMDGAWYLSGGRIRTALRLE
jgi:hypothetical protein